MTALVVVAVTVALGWAIAAARRPVPHRRRVSAPVTSGSPLLPLRWLRRRGGGVRHVADPAPLLRFRTAIERGASTVQAFESVAAGGGPWAAGARRVVQRVASGGGIQPAIDAWSAEEPEAARRLLADALAISSATGGSHLRAVDAVIDAVRERAALQREARALVAQAQSSAVVLVILPVAFAVAVAAFDPRVRAFYLDAPLGPVCVAAGLALDAAGALVMQRLVRSVA